MCSAAQNHQGRTARRSVDAFQHRHGVGVAGDAVAAIDELLQLAARIARGEALVAGDEARRVVGGEQIAQRLLGTTSFHHVVAPQVRVGRIGVGHRIDGGTGAQHVELISGLAVGVEPGHDGLVALAADVVARHHEDVRVVRRDDAHRADRGGHEEGDDDEVREPGARQAGQHHGAEGRHRRGQRDPVVAVELPAHREREHCADEPRRAAHKGRRRCARVPTQLRHPAHGNDRSADRAGGDDDQQRHDHGSGDVRGVVVAIPVRSFERAAALQPVAAEAVPPPREAHGDRAVQRAQAEDGERSTGQTTERQDRGCDRPPASDRRRHEQCANGDEAFEAGLLDGDGCSAQQAADDEQPRPAPCPHRPAADGQSGAGDGPAEQLAVGDMPLERRARRGDGDDQRRGHAGGSTGQRGHCRGNRSHHHDPEEDRHHAHRRRAVARQPVPHPIDDEESLRPIDPRVAVQRPAVAPHSRNGDVAAFVTGERRRHHAQPGEHGDDHRQQHGAPRDAAIADDRTRARQVSHVVVVRERIEEGTCMLRQHEANLVTLAGEGAAADVNNPRGSAQAHRHLVGHQTTRTGEPHPTGGFGDQSIEIRGVDVRGVNAIAHPQRQLQTLDAARVVVERLPRRLGRLACLDERDVALRRAHVPPPPAAAVRVRRATEARVVALLPVQDVVPAFVARLRPVADLVVLQSSGDECIVGGVVLVGQVVVVGMAVRVGGQRRPGLDRQRVGRDVRRTELDHPGQRCSPVVERLTVAAVDHVEVETTADRPRRRRPRHGARCRAVRPTERPQHVGHHRLHTDAHPVDAGVRVGSQQIDGHVVGVALHRHLGRRPPSGSLAGREPGPHPALA